MQWPPEEIVSAVLDNGPFSSELVESWPASLRKDYLELMAIDLAELGMVEFRRQARFLGETYLMSHDTPVADSIVLFRAWRVLTDGEPPPQQPKFDVIP